MSKKGSSAPVPDPVAISNAQSAANIASAQEQQRLNMVGTSGPSGTTGYRADPSQPGGYTQYTNLSPQEQATYDQSKSAENAALGVANQQIGRVNTALANPLDLSNLPQVQNGGVQTSFNTGGPLQYGFNPGQAVQGQVGGDLEAARSQAQNAAYANATSRLDPQFARQGEQLDTKLANQGFGMNSTATGNARDQYARDKNDAYSLAQNNAVTQGNTAANDLFSQQLGQGQFANSAAAQQYTQNQGQAAFNNATAGQDFGQNQSAASFANQAAGQQFQQSLAERQNALQEQAYVQNQPINQFNSLMSSSQLGTPTAINYTPSQVANTDVTGAYALQSQAQQAAAQRAASQSSGMMGGLFSLGSAALMASDIRLKTGVRKVGKLREGIALYAYRYTWGGPEKIGVIAQEVAKVRPQAVRDVGGFLAVDYGEL